MFLCVNWETAIVKSIPVPALHFECTISTFVRELQVEGDVREVSD
jgi:hypothetical protein